MALDTPATNVELLATAIPVGVAKQTFSELNDALLATFLFGMAIGAEDSDRAKRLADVAEDIIRGTERSSREFDTFLTGCNLLVRALSR